MQNPLSLYIHLPWCVRRCPYCDFNAHALKGDLPEDRYVAALLADLAQEAVRAAGRTVSSIFIGGGTPSLFSAHAIGRILDAAAQALTLAEDCEITLEANPGAIEADRFSGFRDAGVNRLSLGVQSFDDRALQSLGRIHDADTAVRAIAAAQRAGFMQLNIDLMHGLPGQDVASALADVERALEFDPGHISHYQLTIEPNTPFFRDPPPLPDEDTLAAIQEGCHVRLTGAGYRQYEVSAWARPGQECRHNLNYWCFGDYLGVGAGAHGKLTLDDGVIVRRWKHRNPTAYIGAARGAGFIDGEARPREDDRIFEYMLNALRLADGFDEREACVRTGVRPERMRTRLDEAARRGLMEAAGGRWRPSPLGRRFLNDLQALFLPDAA